MNPYLELFEKLAEAGPEFLSNIRRKVIWSYAWGIPNSAAIQALRDLGPLLEVGAGSGYWAWMVRQAGGDVVAIDHNSYAPPHWCEVLFGDVSRIKEFPDRTLFLCWPPNHSSMASECLEVYRGQYLAWVGEQRGGVTGNDVFYGRLESDFQLCKRIRIPQWPGCQDALFIFKRNNCNKSN